MMMIIIIKKFVHRSPIGQLVVRVHTRIDCFVLWQHTCVSQR